MTATESRTATHRPARAEHRGVDVMYSEKLTDPGSAVEGIESHSTVAVGQAAGQPPALMQALADRARAGEVDDVKVYYYHAEAPMRASLLQYDLMGRIRPYSMFLQKAERELIQQGLADGGRKVVFFVPTSFGQSVRAFKENIPVDTFIVMVSPMDTHGYFTFGTNNDYTSQVARFARRLVVEVNPNMPRVFGQSGLHISEVDVVVEHTSELPSLAPRAAHPAERVAAKLIAELVPDGATLQVGVGGLPDAVCKELTGRVDLGVHSEFLGPGAAALIRSGAANGRRKVINPGKALFTFAMGDADFYEFLDDNQALESWPVDYVNDPAVIARNDDVISINSTIEMDLTGACNSEYLGGHQFSASGGQLDFIRGAYASRGGKSFIAFASTTKDDTISKIVPRLSGPVTTPRNDVHYVVTEYGVINLQGKSSTERAQALIGLAHPAFREGLQRDAHDQHLL